MHSPWHLQCRTCKQRGPCTTRFCPPCASENIDTKIRGSTADLPLVTAGIGHMCRVTGHGACLGPKIGGVEPVQLKPVTNLSLRTSRVGTRTCIFKLCARRALYIVGLSKSAILVLNASRNIIVGVRRPTQRFECGDAAHMSLQSIYLFCCKTGIESTVF